MVDSGVRGGFVSWLRRGVALVGVGVLVGCGVVGDLGEDRSQLPVLLEDPMAAGGSHGGGGSVGFALEREL